MMSARLAPDPRYPVGPFVRPSSVTAGDLDIAIQEIAGFPAKLRAACAGLTDQQLDTPYREGGWTVRQVVHHVADSHAHSYLRFHFALAEDHPTIQPYPEALWAELPDGKSAPIELSLTMIAGLHARWAWLLRHMTSEQFLRTFRHPEMKDPARLDWIAAMYAWHCRHHLGHIQKLRERMGW